MVRADRLDGLRGSDSDMPGARLGQDIRAARERLGWPLEAVADHLRIRQPYLVAIEDGRPGDLPGSAYAVGFVRAYAKAVGLDPDEAARRFRAEAGEPPIKPELSFPAPVPERGVPALAVVAIGAILVVGAYAARYRMSGNERPGPEAVQVVPDRLTPLVAERPVAPTAAPPAAVPEAEPQMATNTLPPEIASVSPSSAAAAVAPPPPPGARIVVRARSDSWIQVKDPTGQVLLNKVLRGGETWTVPDRPAQGGAAGTKQALLLTTGNAGGTELLVDGVQSASLGTDGAVRRDLPLDADAIRDGKFSAPPAAAFRVSPHNQ